MMILPIGMKRKNNFSQKGFTLVELILVILLVSVIVGISTPLFRRTFSGLELKNSSHNIVKLINYVQEMSIIDKLSYKINFAFDQGTFWITRRGEDTEIFEKLVGKYGRIFSLPRGISISGEKQAITFYPDGRCDGGELTLSEKNGQTLVLSVKGFGSRVEVKEHEDNG